MITIADALAVGLAHHRARRFDRAELIYRHVLTTDPDQPDALHLLGLLRHEAGKHDAALALIEQAVSIEPGKSTYHANLGFLRYVGGDLTAAASSLRRALALDPETPEAWSNLGLICVRLEDLDTAALCCRYATLMGPDNALVWNNLGAVWDRLGSARLAAECYRRAVSIQLDYADAHDHLGQALASLNRPVEAEACHRRALALDPSLGRAFSGLAVALNRQGKADLAIAACLQSIALEPSYAEGWTNLGSLYHERRRLSESVASHCRALALAPDLAIAQTNLGAACSASGLLDQAVSFYQRALDLRPNYAVAHNNLAIALQAAGRLDAATICYRRAIALQPNFQLAHINLILAMLYDPALMPTALMAEIARLVAAQPTRPMTRFANSRDPNRRLRIGYLSANFYRSPVGRNLEPFYAGRDHDGFEIFSYANVAAEDDLTGCFRSHSDHWCSVVGWTDDEVAARIHADAIDILVSISGWLDGNRPMVAARRPAPIQITALDAATSGLATMDYWVTDEYLHPPDTTDPHVEELVRLPHLTTFVSFDETPRIGPVPSESQGIVTFGSCNNPAKIRPEVVALWGRILAAVPDSRLVLKYLNWYGNDGVARGYLQMFARAGIDSERIVLAFDSNDYPSHLQFVTSIDVALDPFPFNGWTTTFEALWMGVPVVSLLGQRYVSRSAGSLLRAVGLEDLVAPDHDAYVAIAASLASDRARRAELRRSLRATVQRSPIFDHVGFARRLEAEYRGMWRRWCATP